LQHQKERKQTTLYHATFQT